MAFFRHIETCITRVVDGDTVWIESYIGNQPCRLQHIDAPEVNEPLYREAKEYIEKYWMNKAIWVTATSIDRYGRWIVTIEDHQGNQLHWELLRKGLVYHFRKYSNDQASFVMEKKARTEGVGLWSNPKQYQKWNERILEKEIWEKKKREEEDNQPILVIILEDCQDSDFNLEEVPEEIIKVNNYRKIDRCEPILKYSDSYIGDI